MVPQQAASTGDWLLDALGVAGTVLATALAFMGALWGVARLVGPTLREQTRDAVREEYDRVGGRLEMIDEHFERRFADLGQRLDRLEARD